MSRGPLIDLLRSGHLLKVVGEPRQVRRLCLVGVAVDLLEDGEELGGPYSDMFVEVVLDAIQERPA